MIRKTASFFIGIMLASNACGQVVTTGISGNSDHRVVIGWDGVRPDYVSASTPNIWNTSPYNSIVHVLPAYCTGEFISPRHILTNSHCGAKCEIGGNQKCEIRTSDGLVLSAREVFVGMPGLDNDQRWNNNQDKDWAILEIVDDYCRKDYRKPQQASSTMGNLWMAGFGSLRVLYPSDISLIRQAYIAYLKATGATDYDGIFIRDKDPNFNTKYKVFLSELTRISGKDFWRDYDSDVNTLKLHTGCGFSGYYKDVPGDMVVLHTCDGWGGNSGSSIKTNSTNEVVGLHFGGWSYITTTDKNMATGEAIMLYKFIYDPNIQSALEKAKRDCANWKPGTKPINPDPIEPKPNKKNCDLTCDNITFVTAGTSGCYNYAGNERKCVAATGKHLRSDGMASDGTYTHTCVGYDKSSYCIGTQQPVPGHETSERKIGADCMSADLPAHATSGHYIGNGTNRLTCGTSKCSCAATSCENGYYLATNARGYSMGWCRSGRCPKGKHPNIINGTKMTGCVDD